MTRTETAVKLQAPSCTRSSRRPGVATTMSTPFRRAFTWSQVICPSAFHRLQSIINSNSAANHFGGGGGGGGFHSCRFPFPSCKTLLMLGLLSTTAEESSRAVPPSIDLSWARMPNAKLFVQCSLPAMAWRLRHTRTECAAQQGRRPLPALSPSALPALVLATGPKHADHALPPPTPCYEKCRRRNLSASVLQCKSTPA